MTRVVVSGNKIKKRPSGRVRMSAGTFDCSCQEGKPTAIGRHFFSELCGQPSELKPDH